MPQAQDCLTAITKHTNDKTWMTWWWLVKKIKELTDGNNDHCDSKNNKEGTTREEMDASKLKEKHISLFSVSGAQLRDVWVPAVILPTRNAEEPVSSHQ